VEVALFSFMNHGYRQLCDMKLKHSLYQSQIKRSCRVSTNLENQGISLTWKSQGISPKVRKLFEAGLSSKANHPRLLKWTYTG